MEELQEKEKLQEKALCYCQAIMRDKINFTELIPRLLKQDLLTKDERDRLNLPSISPADRVDYMIDVLPRKSSGWWGRFIDSLEKSSNGTAHHELAEYLETELRNLNLDDDDSNRGNTPDVAEQMSGHALATSTVNDNREGQKKRRPSRTSVHTASGITQSMCAVGEDPYFFGRRPDIAEYAVEKLKDDLDDVNYKYAVIVDQIKLIELHESLIEKSESFSAALSDVLQLYVNHFKIKKKTNALLSQSELEMIQIIEAVTECTETIDMDKEKAYWESCLDTMHEQHSNLKKILYSIDTDKMVELQKAWSLSSEEAKTKAREWIDERCKVIQKGKDCLIKLENICKGNNASEVVQEIHVAVRKRIKVGESCLEAWSKWITHRTNLCKA